MLKTYYTYYNEINEFIVNLKIRNKYNYYLIDLLKNLKYL